MTAWLPLVSPATRALLAEALRRTGNLEQAAFLCEASAHPGSRKDVGPTSRQARHARLVRTMFSAAASVLVLSPFDEDMEALLLSREMTHLRPLSSETHYRAASLAQFVRFDDLAGYQRYFERMRGRLIELARAVRHAPQEEVLRVQSALVGLFMCAIFFGEAFRAEFQSLRAELQRGGLLDNPYFRMELGILGAWVGHPQDEVQWLLDESVRDFELADLYLFVRTDGREELYELAAALLRGERVDPSACLFGPRPASTLSRVVDYALSCMRDPLHLRNEGLMLMPLVWVDDVQRHVARLERDAAHRQDLRAVHTRLARFERVQLMEKARFFAVLEGIQDEALKRRLEQYWHTSHG